MSRNACLVLVPVVCQVAASALTLSLCLAPVALVSAESKGTLMAEHKVASQVTEAERREQMKLVYDHIKFDIGLYIGTPAALAVVADGLQVKQSVIFATGLILCIAIFLIAGLHAMHFMTKHFLGRWDVGYLERFEAEAFSSRRMFLHHQMYWVGVSLGLIGLTAAFLVSRFMSH